MENSNGACSDLLFLVEKEDICFVKFWRFCYSFLLQSTISPNKFLATRPFPSLLPFIEPLSEESSLQVVATWSNNWQLKINLPISLAMMILIVKQFYPRSSNGASISCICLETWSPHQDPLHRQRVQLWRILSAGGLPISPPFSCPLAVPFEKKSKFLS